MAEYMTTDTELTSVANAIRTKGNTSAPLTYPNGFISAIGAIPTGEQVEFPDLGVTYIDYDGTVIATYTKAEFAELTQHPANPTHTGLTAQGWNWSLSDAKTYVAAEGGLIIGQNYVTDNGRTRLYITIPENAQDVKRIYRIELYSPSLLTTYEFTIYWGDGQSDYRTGNTAGSIYRYHYYETPGDYVIEIEVTAGTLYLNGTSSTNAITVDSNQMQRITSLSIKKVELGNNINIKNYTFNNCSELETISINKNTRLYYNNSTDQNQFNGCYKLKCIVIPDGENKIPAQAFGYCHLLKYVSIPNTVTAIGNSAFSNCESIEIITLPHTVTSMTDLGVFSRCSSLRYAILSPNITTTGNSLFSSCYSLKMIKYTENITSLGQSTFDSCMSLISLKLSNSITSLPNYTFNNLKSLRSLTLPSSATSIGIQCFSGMSSLESITLPNITSIPERAFNNCNALKSVNIPNTVTSIGDNAFSECYCLKEITIPNSVTAIGQYCFSNNISLNKAVLSNLITSINPNTFVSCTSLKKVENFEHVTTIPDNAFQNCNCLSDISVSDNVTSIGQYAFSNCYLLDIDLPSKLESIGRNAFSYCYNLKKAIIPEGITEIPTYAFNNCYSLSSVSIPSTVTSIGTYAFSNMYALKEMHVYATTPPTIAASNSLSSLYLYAVIFVPEGCLSAYKSTTTWSIYADNMLEDVEYTISDVDSSAFTTVDYRISTPTSFESQANGGQIINVSNYKRIEFFTTGTTTAAFLSSYDPTASLTSQRVTSSNISISYSREFHSSYNVPEGAQYFFINGSTPPPIFKAWTVVTT